MTNKLIYKLLVITLTTITMTNFHQMNGMESNKCVYDIRKATIHDKDNLKILYQRVASTPGGLARTTEEITETYISKLLFNGINNGLALVAEHEGKLIGSIFKYRLEPKVFSHVLAEGSILVDPDFQGKGIGSNLITTFLNEIKENYPDILRVELMVRESNPAIKLYKKLGFTQEGRFEGRIKGIYGQLEADIAMVWINPKFVFTNNQS